MRNLVAIAIVCLLGALLPSLVSADIPEGDSNPGTRCYSDSSSWALNEVYAYVYNSSTTTDLVVSCPVTPDLRARDALAVDVEVVDNNDAGDNIVCWGYILGDDFQSITDSDFDTTPSGTGNDTLHIHLDVPSGSWIGTHSIWCDLPETDSGSSRIYMYESRGSI